MKNEPRPLNQTYLSLQRSFEAELSTQPDEDWNLLHNSRDLNLSETLRGEIDKVPDQYKHRLEAEFLGLGPLGELISDPEVTEILVAGGDKIWFERQGKLQRYGENFLGFSTFQKFFYECLDEAKIIVNLKKPFGDGEWRGFRLHAMIPPLAEEFCLSLRRQKSTKWTLDQLLERKWAPSDLVESLAADFRSGKTFIIFGDTGSGKTAAAEAFLDSLPKSCRVVILEDTREIRPPNLASARLLVRPSQEEFEEIGFSELLRQSLRMRPDRLMMGEIRGPEAKDFLMVLSSGHKGGLATLHADSGQRALLRLEMLIQLGAPQWDLRSVRLLIAHSISYLLKVGRDPTGRRVLLSVDRIDGYEETGLLLENIYTEQN